MWVVGVEGGVGRGERGVGRGSPTPDESTYLLWEFQSFFYFYESLTTSLYLSSGDWSVVLLEY